MGEKRVGRCGSPGRAGAKVRGAHSEVRTARAPERRGAGWGRPRRYFQSWDVYTETV